jgi:hypothetical protein
MVADIDRQIAFCNFRLARMLFPVRLPLCLASLSFVARAHLFAAGNLRHPLLAQLNNRWYIAIVNKVADAVAKAIGSSLTQAEVFFLKSVVRALQSLVIISRTML